MTTSNVPIQEGLSDAIPVLDNTAGINNCSIPGEVHDPDNLAPIPLVPQGEGKELLTGLEDLMAMFNAFREETRSNFHRLEKSIEITANQLGFLPPQVRNLGTKIEGMAGVISDSRHRSLLLNVLALHDLTDQMIRGGSGHGLDVEGQRCLDAILKQIRQELDCQGVTMIEAEGGFNPALHRAIQISATSQIELADTIREVVRPGFTSAGRILRYAEVVVWRLEPSIQPAALSATVVAASDDAGAGNQSV